MMERMKYAQRNRRKKQAEETGKKNKDKENAIFILGEKVWVRDEPRTDVDSQTHKKLRLPWDGPFEISGANTEDYGNSYQVKRMVNEKEDIRVVNVKNLKRYVERPEWMKSEEDDWLPEMEVEMTNEEKVEEAKDTRYIPPEESRKRSVETMEEPVRVGMRPQRSQWMKKPGDLIDMKFKKKEKNRWVMHWACGTIQKIDEDNKNRWYCTFMDGEEGWYDLEDDKDGKLGSVRKVMVTLDQRT